ncbi:MAG: hypothetical protein H6724_10885 [Sandaracinus sp.]|nr:hypothetical protein [Sandaracinus sp.]
MRWLLVLALVGLWACGASPPPLEAHERAFAAERGVVAIDGLRCELPVERFVAVEARFEHATIFLEAAPMGASLESLADDEAETLALTTGAEVSRARAFVGARPAVALTAGARHSLVAMTTPWRVLRARGDRGVALGEGEARLGDLRFVPPGSVREVILRGAAEVLTLRPGEPLPAECDE